jgi:hypothetical protein
MAELNKAIGLRIPPKLWEEIKGYGLENYPGSKSKEGFDVTKTIVSLLAQALETPLDNTADHFNASSDERIMEMIRQELDKAINPITNDLLDLKSQLANLNVTHTNLDS